MPLDLQDLTWTDSDTVCAQLAAFLAQPPSPVDDGETVDTTPEHRVRARAAVLLSRLGDAAHGNLLTRILLDLHEHDDTRLAALDGLVRHGVRLPASCLDALGPDDNVWFTQRWPAEFCDYLSLLQAASGSPGLRKYLKRLTPHHRAQHLIRFLAHPCGDSAGLCGWLYRQWVRKDRARLDADPHNCLWEAGRRIHLNVKIISLTRLRPESAALLERYRSQPADAYVTHMRLCGTPLSPDGWESVPAELWSGVAEVVEAVRGAPHAYQAHADCLNLPYEALLEYFTPETLQLRIETEIRLAQARCSEAQAGQNISDCLTTPTYRALELLQKSPEDVLDAQLQSLILCPEMHQHGRYVWRHLYDIYWERIWRFAADTCRESVRAWISENSGREDRGRALLKLCAHPEPEDREFFWRCLDEPKKPEFRFRAIQALEALGEDSTKWRARLHELVADADPFTAMEARMALYRRGDLGQLDTIARFADYVEPGLPADAEMRQRCDAASFRNYDENRRMTRGACVRATALRQLGEVDPARFRTSFAAVLLNQAIPDGWFYQAPDRLEAAYHLARLDDDAARTVLLRACLSGPAWLAEWIIPHGLLSAADPQPPTPRDTLTDAWRNPLSWEWRCC